MRITIRCGDADRDNPTGEYNQGKVTRYHYITVQSETNIVTLSSDTIGAQRSTSMYLSNAEGYFWVAGGARQLSDTLADRKDVAIINIQTDCQAVARERCRKIVRQLAETY